MTNFELYLVGGAVRDGLLNLPTKDLDFTVVTESYGHMKSWLESQGFDIFVETPEFFTIRARFPKGWGAFAGRSTKNMTGDFVLARKESTYTDGRHPDIVEMGTLEDDLRRRDFTVNALAQDVDGNIVDLFDGLKDLENKKLRAVGNTQDRFTDDALRALRAIRFSVTKGMRMDISVLNALKSNWLPPLMVNVNSNRKRDELLTAFHCNTLGTLHILANCTSEAFREAAFVDGLWLKPTLEK